MPVIFHLDESGVPFTDYGRYNNIDIGIQRSILSVAECGLWYMEYLQKRSKPIDGKSVLISREWDHVFNESRLPKNEDDAYNRMINCSEWLLNNIHRFDNFSAWMYPYPFSYNTHADWKSAHAQAVGMQFLARVARLYGESCYQEPIEELLRAFEQPVSKGGLLEVSPGGNFWFAKFADSQNQSPRILNGHMFAVLGLIDISQLLSIKKAKTLADSGAEAITESLPKYDLGYWSAYDIFGKPAPLQYHRIHILQLSRLFAIYGVDKYLNYHDIFVRYMNK